MTSLSILNEFSAAADLDTHQIDINKEGYYAIVNGKDILLKKRNSDKTIKLCGHHSYVSAICFNYSSDNIFLASAGSYYIIIWDVNKVVEASQVGDEIRGTVLTKLENISQIMLCFSKKGKKLCSVASDEIRIYDTTDGILLFSKCGKNFTKASFLYENIIILIFENFKIEAFNVEEEVVLWTSNIFSNTICSLSNKRNIFVVGFSNNVIKSFSIDEDNRNNFTCRENLEIDLDQELFRLKMQKNLEEMPNNGRIITVFVLKLQSSGDSKDTDTFKIICATNHYIFIIDYMSQEVEVLQLEYFRIEAISEIQFCQNDDGLVHCVAITLFQPKILMLKCNIASDEDNESLISILPKEPLLENSVLKCDLLPRKPQQNGAKSRDKSLTFHTKIKSSGYSTKPPNRQMFKPVTSTNTKPKVAVKPKSVPILKRDVEKFTNWSLPFDKIDDARICDCAINHISVSECNRHLTCSLTNKTALVINRIMKKHLTTLYGHDGPVIGTSWSNDSANLLTYSADCTVKLWSLSQPGKPILNLEHLHGNLSKKKVKITKEIIHSQFYYMDKFIILSFGNSFGLYSYYIDGNPKSDVKRYLEKNKYKLVKLFTLSEVQNITSMSTPNNIYSYIVLVCGSDKSIQTYDMNVGKIVGKIENAHRRPVFQTTHNTGSSYVQPSSYDMFATTAPSDGIKTWDFRTMKCSAKFKSHPDATACSFNSSPCGNFLATTGDNRSLHVYDIRKAKLIQSSTQLKDRMSSVCFAKDGSQIYFSMRNGWLSTFAVC